MEAAGGAEAAVAVAQRLSGAHHRAEPGGGLCQRPPATHGDYVSTGKPVFSMVDVESFHVEGYFEETKHGIRVGAPVDIRIMGEAQPLRGHVQSIAAGIEDRDRSNGATLLPNVNPTFNWVRLAQRVPVRIVFDAVPAGVRLVSGRTATVSVREDGAAAAPQSRS